MKFKITYTDHLGNVIDTTIIQDIGLLIHALVDIPEHYADEMEHAGRELYKVVIERLYN